ncbi:hypothetical protein BPAE_0112g00190 [Botrytis paeoniae]|uniref:Uncharacterized protein n=1 Tax=Botrytis paeoniae TaxID=278948 RepID=A0A4Z1FKQ3_9HELO|nr:hypothetical protein BPAE_0112g00190 [Botrytis paeoniae]
MGLQASFQHFIFKLKSENRKDYIYPKQTTISCHEKRQNSSWPVRKSSISSRVRLMSERFKSHTTCPSKYKTKDGECSMVDHVEALCIRSTEVSNPCSEVPSNKTFPNRTASTISLNSRNKPPASALVGHDVTPSAEVDRHTGVAKRNTIMADVLTIHATHSGKPQEYLPSTPNSHSTPQISPTNHEMDRNRVQTSPTSILPKELLPNAIHVSNSTQSYDFPMASRRTLEQLEDEVHRSCEGLRTLKKQIVDLKEQESGLQQRNHLDREECSQAVRALQEMAFKSWREGKWLPAEHDTINLEIPTLQAAMSGWTRGVTSDDYRPEDLSEVFEREDQAKNALREELSKVMVFKNDMLPEGLPQKRAKKFLLIISSRMFSRRHSLFSEINQRAWILFIERDYHIYQQAAGLAYHLWTRRSMLKIVTLKDLNSFFHIRDPQMALHTSVQEDVENTLTGQSMSLVIYPGIVVYGLDECVDYETPRPWMPAKVLLHKPLSKKPQVPAGKDSEMKG